MNKSKKSSRGKKENHVLKDKIIWCQIYMAHKTKHVKKEQLKNNWFYKLHRRLHMNAMKEKGSRGRHNRWEKVIQILLYHLINVKVSMVNKIWVIFWIRVFNNIPFNFQRLNINRKRLSKMQLLTSRVILWFLKEQSRTSLQITSLYKLNYMNSKMMDLSEK